MIKFFRRIRQQLLAESKFSKYLLYAVGEIVLVVIGILIALSINNWNQDRLEERKIQSKLNLIHKELIEDISALEKEVKNRNKKVYLMTRSLHIIENATSLSALNRQVLDSAFIMYRRMDPLFNNSRTYEAFLSTETDLVDDEIYAKLNEYLDFFNEGTARIERMAQIIIQPEFDILLSSSVKRRSSGEFDYSLKMIQEEYILYEIIRHSKQHFQAISNHYSKVLVKAQALEREIKNKL